MGLPRQADPRIAYGGHVTAPEASQRGIGEARSASGVHLVGGEGDAHASPEINFASSFGATSRVIR